MEELEIILEKEADKEQEIGILEEEIKEVYPELENLVVTPSNEEQKFKSSKYGYDEVTVNAIESEEITITPSTEEQVKEGLFNKVTVGGIAQVVDELETTLKTLLMGQEESTIKIPEDITELRAYCFYEFANLKSIEFPKKFKNINQNSFTKCTGLTEIIINDELEEIGQSAFSSCSNLEKVVISGELKKIGSSAFRYCTNLKKVVFLNLSKMTSGSMYMFESTEIANGNGAIYVPDNLVDSFTKNAYWGKKYPIKPLSELEE